MSRICSVSECGQPHEGLGYCSAHYQRYKTRGTVDADQEVTKSNFLERNSNWRGGKRSHPLYYVYHDMVARCQRQTHPSYSRYGGRGIRVAEEWVSDFWNFIRDMGDRPEGVTASGRALYSLDRIDNDGDYSPGNVRWATPTQQANNKRGFGDFESRRDPETGRFK